MLSTSPSSFAALMIQRRWSPLRTCPSSLLLPRLWHVARVSLQALHGSGVPVSAPVKPVCPPHSLLSRFLTSKSSGSHYFSLLGRPHTAVIMDRHFHPKPHPLPTDVVVGTVLVRLLRHRTEPAFHPLHQEATPAAAGNLTFSILLL